MESVIATDEARWLQILRQRCEATSQSQVARELSYSAAVINQVLKGTYVGNLDNVEKAVRGAFLGETVNCPVMGELEANRCLEHQRQPYAATNRQRVQLYRACRTCANNKTKAQPKPGANHE